MHLAEEDLASAANGAIVTRVVYLEHPEEALPTAQNRHEQPYFDVSTHRDPLRVAQQLGRPMAIARCGSRIPDEFELPSFTFGGPPLQLYAVFDDAAVRPSPEQSAGVAASPPDQKN